MKYTRHDTRECTLSSRRHHTWRVSLVVVFCVGEGGDGGGGHFRRVTPAATGQREPAAFHACAAPILAGGDREQFVNALEALVEEVLQEEIKKGIMGLASIDVSRLELITQYLL